MKSELIGAFVILCIFIVLMLIFAIIGLFEVTYVFRFAKNRNNKKTVGELTQVYEHEVAEKVGTLKLWTFDAKFTTSEGENIFINNQNSNRNNIMCLSNPQKFKTGDMVEIVYNPENPYKMIVVGNYSGVKEGLTRMIPSIILAVLFSFILCSIQW